MLDGLEAPDGTAELDTGLGVVDRALQAALGAPDLLGRERHRGEVERLGQTGLGTTVGPDQPRRCVGELDAGLLAGLVHRGECRTGESGGTALDGEQGQAGGGPSDDQEEIGDVSVDDERLVTVERPALPGRRGGEADAVSVPATRVLGKREGGDGLARGDARKEGLLGLLVT